MAIEDNSSGREIEKIEGQILIRRFTDRLEGSNELERTTKAAQKKADDDCEAEHHARMRKLFESPDSSSLKNKDFEVAEIAKSALQQTCDKFDKESKPSRITRLTIPRHSARSKANKMMRDSVSLGVNDFKSVIDDLDAKWKASNGVVYRTFQRLCATLDDHKSVFTIFPSQNDYASVLCNGLAVLVKAAVNTSAIAETLAECVTEISAKAATCAILIEVNATSSLRRRLADIYAHVFRFYRDTLEWYLSSKTSKFFGGFNENVKANFEKAAIVIKDRIEDMYRESSIGDSARLYILDQDVSDIKREISNQRQSSRHDENRAGEQMLRMFDAILTELGSQRLALQFLAHGRDKSELRIPNRVQSVTSCDAMTKEQILAHSQRLEGFIVGEEGPELFGNGRFWLAEDEVLAKLRDWMANYQDYQVLWISSPYEPGSVAAAKAAAMAVVAVAWQAKTPIISHFCQRPRSNHISRPLTIEQAGLIGLLYSLIRQLLQFNHEDEGVDLDEETFRKLDGGIESWPVGLHILRRLLDRAPRLLYCVIDNLSDLEWSSGAGWCHGFLDVLFEVQQQKSSVLHILLTTSGQSKVLPRRIALEAGYMAKKTAREVARTGRRIELEPTERL